MIQAIESKVLDINSEAIGIRASDLMENAGRAVAEFVLSKFSENSILVACGTGNNGGDGIVAARYLADAGRNVTIALVVPKEDMKSSLLLDNLNKLPKSVKFVEKAKPSIIKDFPIIIDALLGTGLRAEPREPYASWIQAINDSGTHVISIDVPSGLGTSLRIKPEMTVSIHDVKEGMTPKNSGKIFIANIGIPPDAVNYIGPGELLYYPIPARDSHKGQNGRLLIIGGGPYSGAPALSAFAAQAIGVDLVTIATPEISASVIASYSPTFIVRSLEGKFLTSGNLETIYQFIKDVDAILIGPGLGRDPETVKAVRELLLKIKLPVVVDADGLFAMSAGKFPAFVIPAVLTPHAKEFTRLGGSKQLSSDAVNVLAKKFNCTILLKQPIDIISDGQRYKLNRTGNPKMSVGGTGDVLAGLVAGLLAKGVEPYNAARVGAYLCGLAGDNAFASVGYSMTATDVVACVPTVLSRGLSRI